MNDGRKLVEDDELIKDHIHGFYQDLFTETEGWRPSWEDDTLRKLRNEDNEWLERPFTFEEVERVINFCFW